MIVADVLAVYRNYRVRFNAALQKDWQGGIGRDYKDPA